MVTNYHVLRLVGDRAHVNGEAVKQWWAATGPEDQDAKPVPSFTQIFKYTMVRDIAVLRVAKPLAKKGMRAPRLFNGELQPVEPVTIVSFPSGKIRVTKGYYDGVMSDGLLRFQLDSDLFAGASGGVVLNSKDEAVGLLCGIEKSHRAAYAVPVWSIADFLKQVQPQLYASIITLEPFRPQLGPIMVSRKMPEALALLDYDPEPIAPPGSIRLKVGVNRFNPSPALPGSYLRTTTATPNHFSPVAALTLLERPHETEEVQQLRRSATAMVRDMANLTAIQTITFPNNSVWEHEVRVEDGKQVFVGPDGKAMGDLPMPRTAGNAPGSDWSELPETLGSNLRLPLRYLGQRTESGIRLHTFEYRASVEDKVCSLKAKMSLFRPTWKGHVECYGDVWTDADFNIVRITEHLTPPPKSGVRLFSATVIYGWLRDASIKSRLVPHSMYLRCEQLNGKTIDSWVSFTNYHVFQATARIIESGD